MTRIHFFILALIPLVCFFAKLSLFSFGTVEGDLRGSIDDLHVIIMSSVKPPQLVPLHPCRIDLCFSVGEGAVVTGDDGSKVFVVHGLQFFAIDADGAVGFGAAFQVLCLFDV